MTSTHVSTTTTRCLVTGATGYIGGRLVPREVDDEEALLVGGRQEVLAVAAVDVERSLAAVERERVLALRQVHRHVVARRELLLG